MQNAPTTQSADQNPLIELKQIRKVFLTDEIETHALAEINLAINKGEFVAIAGPSGCGKSTLLSILGLLDSPSEGDYTLNGHAVSNLNHAERARTDLSPERLPRLIGQNDHPAIHGQRDTNLHSRSGSIEA